MLTQREVAAALLAAVVGLSACATVAEPGRRDLVFLESAAGAEPMAWIKPSGKVFYGKGATPDKVILHLVREAMQIAEALRATQAKLAEAESKIPKPSTDPMALVAP